MKIFCIIPAYNEASNITEVLKQVIPVVFEVVVVNDGSTDNTLELATKSGATVLNHLINQGQGTALKTGTKYAILNNADIIVHFDADGQFSAFDIEKVAKPIIDGRADIVFGSRFLGVDSNMPLFKKNIIMPLARMVNKHLLGVRLTDPQSGFRAMSRESAKKFNWDQSGMAHASEILYAVTKAGLKIEEVPIKVTYHDFGQRFSGGLKIIKDLFLSILIN